jgi:hypothetical protein
MMNQLSRQLMQDALGWFFLVVFLGLLAFAMMKRDVSKQYGTLAFGNMPPFQGRDCQGELMDVHKMHGRLTVVMIGQEEYPLHIKTYLYKLAQATVMGKKQLYQWVLLDQPQQGCDKNLKYITLPTDKFQEIHSWRERTFKKGVLLIDQNAVIRGVFDLNDKLERMKFESAVKAIL